MWVPTRPLGCGPAKASTDAFFTVMALPSRLQNQVLADSLARKSVPSWRSSSKPLTTTSGSAARGLVSMALMNTAAGVDEGEGTRPKGRSRRAVQSPDSVRRATAWSRS